MLVLSLVLFCIFVMVARSMYVAISIYKTRRSPFSNAIKHKQVKTLIVAGSGGHTTEILTMVRSLGKAYNPRHYIIADSDTMSKTKIEELERSRSRSSTKRKEIKYSFIPRSREVSQSWTSTVWTTLVAGLSCFPLVFTDPPDLILVNGPGTCIPVCAAGVMLTVLGVHHVRVVYVESVCRVETLSLSGKILYYFADQVLVQWPQLQDKYPLTHYIGRVV